MLGLRRLALGWYDESCIYQAKDPYLATSVALLLKEATTALQLRHIASPRLDAEVLLAHALGATREWLHAHGDDSPGSLVEKRFQAFLSRRAKHEPIAYILGRKEFYGREFIVTPDVLIPRPETEALIELVRETAKMHPGLKRLLDVGCGSGCIGITLKLTLSDVSVTLSDISREALTIARKNAARLGAKPIRYVESNLLAHWLNHAAPKQFDGIVANLPYVDRSWETSAETAFEPSGALYAQSGGLALIFELIEQSQMIIRPGGFLFLEADPEQHQAIINHAEKHHFTYENTRDYALSFLRQA